MQSLKEDISNIGLIIIVKMISVKVNFVILLVWIKLNSSFTLLIGIIQGFLVYSR